MFCCMKPTRLTRQGRAKSRYSKASDLTVRSTKDCMHTVQKPTLKSSPRILTIKYIVCMQQDNLFHKAWGEHRKGEQLI